MSRDEVALEVMKIFLTDRPYNKWKKQMKLYGFRTIPETIAELSFMIADAMVKKAMK